MVVHYNNWNFWFPIHEPFFLCLPNPIAQFEDVGWSENLVAWQPTSIGANLLTQLPPINFCTTSPLQKPFQLWLTKKRLEILPTIWAKSFIFNQRMKICFVDFYFHPKTMSFATMITCNLSNKINGILVAYIACD
jgi:hypothetical protein